MTTMNIRNDNSDRGLGSASEATKRRVAKKGGEESHGGGRPQGS
jgi:hypothetical protein